MAEQRRVAEAEEAERYHRLWAEWATSLGEYEARERQARIACEQAEAEAATLRARAAEAVRAAEAGRLAWREQSEELDLRVEELQVTVARQCYIRADSHTHTRSYFHTHACTPTRTHVNMYVCMCTAYSCTFATIWHVVVHMHACIRLCKCACCTCR